MSQGGFQSQKKPVFYGQPRLTAPLPQASERRRRGPTRPVSAAEEVVVGVGEWVDGVGEWVGEGCSRLLERDETARVVFSPRCGSEKSFSLSSRLDRNAPRGLRAAPRCFHCSQYFGGFPSAL